MVDGADTVYVALNRSDGDKSGERPALGRAERSGERRVRGGTDAEPAGARRADPGDAMTPLLIQVAIFAAVQQPNGVTIPTPVIECAGGKPGGLGAVFACACTTAGTCNIGAPCPGGSTSCDDGKHGTCERPSGTT